MLPELWALIPAFPAAFLVLSCIALPFRHKLSKRDVVLYEAITTPVDIQILILTMQMSHNNGFSLDRIHSDITASALTLDHTALAAVFAKAMMKHAFPEEKESP